MIRIAIGVLLVIFGWICFSQCSNSFRDGKWLYEQNCENCHGTNGEGLAGLIPPLAQADFLEKNYNQLPCIILHGMEGEVEVNGKTYNNPMQGYPELTTFDIVLLINYINHSWGNDAKYTDFREVEANLQNCQ